MFAEVSGRSNGTEENKTQEIIPLSRDSQVFVPLVTVLNNNIQDRLEFLSEKQDVQSILGVNDKHQAFQVLLSDSYCTQTPLGRKVIYLATLQKERLEFLDLAEGMQTELYGQIGAYIDPENTFISLERYWLPDTDRIIRVLDNLSSQFYLEKNEHEGSAEESKAMQNFAYVADLIDDLMKRSEVSEDFVRRRLETYLSCYPEQQHRASEVVGKLFYAIAAAGYPKEVVDIEVELGLSELPVPSFQDFDSYCRRTENLYSRNEEATVEALDVRVKATLEARVLKSYQGVDPKRLAPELPRLILEEAHRVPWLMFAGTSFVGLSRQAQVEIEAWCLENDYQAVSTHVHPYLPLVYPGLTKELETKRAMFSLEKTQEVVFGQDRAELCDNSILAWEQQIQLHGEKVLRYTDFCNRLKTLKGQSLNHAWELIEREFSNKGGLFAEHSLDFVTGSDDLELKIDYRLAMVANLAASDQEKIDTARDYIAFIEESRAEILNCSKSKLLQKLLERPLKHEIRGHTFSESVADANAAVKFRLKGADGSILNEYVTVIENSLGTIVVTSSDTHPKTVVSRLGFRDTMSLSYDQYRQGQIIENRYELLSDSYGRAMEALSHLGTRYNILPPSFVRDTSTDSLHLLIPSEGSVTFGPAHVIQCKFLNALTGIAESGLSVRSEIIAGVPVRLYAVGSQVLLDLERRTRVSEGLKTLGFSTQARQEALEYLERVYRANRVLSHATYADRQRAESIEKDARNLGSCVLDSVMTGAPIAVAQEWYLDPKRNQTEFEALKGHATYRLESYMKFMSDEARGWFISKMLPSATELEGPEFEDFLKNLVREDEFAKYLSDYYQVSKDRLTEIALKLEGYATEYEGLYFDYVDELNLSYRHILSHGIEDLVSIMQVAEHPTPSKLGLNGMKTAVRLALLESPRYGHHWGMNLPVVLLQAVQKLEESLPDVSRWTAFLTDRIRVTAGQKQVFGTQGYLNMDHHWTVCPIENEYGLAARRRSLGLEDFKKYEQRMQNFDFSGVRASARQEAFRQLVDER